MYSEENNLGIIPTKFERDLHFKRIIAHLIEKLPSLRPNFEEENDNRYYLNKFELFIETNG